MKMKDFKTEKEERKVKQRRYDAHSVLMWNVLVVPVCS